MLTFFDDDVPKSSCNSEAAAGFEPSTAVGLRRLCQLKAMTVSKSETLASAIKCWVLFVLFSSMFTVVQKTSSYTSKNHDWMHHILTKT